MSGEWDAPASTGIAQRDGNSPQGRHSLSLTLVAALVAVAAALYIGQFVWSFKTASDDRYAAERARAQKIINDKIRRMCAENDPLLTKEVRENCRAGLVP